MSNASCSVRIECEIPLSAKTKSLGLELNKIECISFDSIDDFESDRWNELVVDENKRLYLEYQKLSISEEDCLKTNIDSLSLKKLEDFSGEINCHALIPFDEEEYDFFIAIQLIFIEGELAFAKALSEEFVENQKRKENQAKLSRNISKKINRQKSFWFKIYNVYDFFADLAFSLLIKFINIQFKLAVFLEKIFRPIK